jgi:hypothetical protein
MTNLAKLPTFDKDGNVHPLLCGEFDILRANVAGLGWRQ